MARYFSQSDIDKFKECFFYHARKSIKNEENLSIIMRSLGYSPTKEEVSKYFTKYGPDIEFASFLECMHDHKGIENPEKELINAFKAHDTQSKGYVNASEVRHILMNLGEKLTSREVEAMLRDAGTQPGGQIRYNEFVKTLLTPVPDY
ncbi:calmodulin-like protein 4 [Mytilus californianus]|uniref:calmodulin-like protein 4 n=1 Tax=Mytilus californianus TaxID=6549 RepID=UPI0022477AC5|nr:calmodulin-like protein 4 [Mytilus californianus]